MMLPGDQVFAVRLPQVLAPGCSTDISLGQLSGSGFGVQVPGKSRSNAFLNPEPRTLIHVPDAARQTTSDNGGFEVCVGLAGMMPEADGLVDSHDATGTVTDRLGVDDFIAEQRPGNTDLIPDFPVNN
jgi:hypothetical protein